MASMNINLSVVLHISCLDGQVRRVFEGLCNRLFFTCGPEFLALYRENCFSDANSKHHYPVFIGLFIMLPAPKFKIRSMILACAKA